MPMFILMLSSFAAGVCAAAGSGLDVGSISMWGLATMNAGIAGYWLIQIAKE